MNSQKEAFDSLQDRMVEQASIYKGTKFDPFYRFTTGEMDWKECIDRIVCNLEGDG
jgi:hypothetical protein